MFGFTLRSLLILVSWQIWAQFETLLRFRWKFLFRKKVWDVKKSLYLLYRRHYWDNKEFDEGWCQIIAPGSAHISSAVRYLYKNKPRSAGCVMYIRLQRNRAVVLIWMKHVAIPIMPLCYCFMSACSSGVIRRSVLMFSDPRDERRFWDLNQKSSWKMYTCSTTVNRCWENTNIVPR